ncbi:MAG: hypothetical protein Q9M25_08525 [Mariprofundaceae bacterium]|nr:hypothetical protein [Mariprofundaceae bacterium]
MKKMSVIGLFAGIMLVSAPVVYAEPGMSDAQHRKTMGGLHHPGHDQSDSDSNSEKNAVMSDSQHRKSMGGLHHPDREDESTKDSHEGKRKPSMSDSQHRKNMGGLHHPKD